MDDSRARSWSEFTQDEGDAYQATPAICTVHMRFVPCRVNNGCVISEDPADIEETARSQLAGIRARRDEAHHARKWPLTSDNGSEAGT